MHNAINEHLPLGIIDNLVHFKPKLNQVFL